VSSGQRGARHVALGTEGFHHRAAGRLRRVAPGVSVDDLPPAAEAVVTQRKIMRSALARALASVIVLGAFIGAPTVARADEGGVSFWVPGFFGSLAATPQQPGWTLAAIYYHTSVKAGADVAFARQVSRGQITANFNASLNASLNADADLGFAIPTYVFATPVLGGQATVALVVPFGRNTVSVDATVTGALGPLGFTVSGGRTDSVSGFGDLIPQFNLRWNYGVHNFMTYITGDIPVGAYDSTRLANLGIGHGAIDAGGGYTYFNPQTGLEYSAVLGFTYNFKNESTQYQNGVDMHLDLGGSQFVTKQLQLGMVGYFYNQLSCDSGSGDRVGCFESRVAGIGPQIGYIFPLGDLQGYLNLKAYGEFAAEHRPHGINAWLTFVISPAAPTASTPRPRIAK
jgi:hypothetical protein